VNGQNKITTKISVAIVGIFERYTYKEKIPTEEGCNART
jgi:hypothetical protein